MKLSIVSTLYMSEMYVGEFLARSHAAARLLAGDDYEIILVHDGSPDRSLQLAVAATQRDAKLVVVDLSRNFGHHKALMTGLAYAHGEQVFLLDSDLEEEPEWLSQFARVMQQEQADVVFGQQVARKGGMLERQTGAWFYRAFRILSGVSIPANIVTARLMSQRYVLALLQHQEREVFLAGLWQITGYHQVACPITKHNTSATTYTLRHKFSLLINSVTSFSNLPLIYIFYIGVLISLLSGVYAMYLVINWLFLSTPLLGWTSMMASIWLIGGLIISFVGVVGIYLSKVFSETKQRPYTLVRQVHGRS